MIRSLRIFCDVVETQSFTETARRNYITQSAVSHHLKTLEQQFGHQLLERGRPPHLTKAGSLVYATAQTILEQHRQLEAALKQSTREVTGALRVAAIYTAGLYDLPPYATVFLQRYPHVDLQLSYLKAPDIYAALLAKRVDIGLVDYPKPHSRLTALPFLAERLVLIVPRAHPLAARKRASLRWLNDQPFIVAPAELPLGKAIQQVLHKARVRARIAHRFDNVEIVKRAVAIGLGLAIVPRVALANELKTDQVKALELREGPFERPIGILVRKQWERSLPAQKLIEILQSPRHGRSA